MRVYREPCGQCGFVAASTSRLRARDVAAQHRATEHSWDALRARLAASESQGRPRRDRRAHEAARAAAAVARLAAARQWEHGDPNYRPATPAASAPRELAARRARRQAHAERLAELARQPWVGR